MIANGVHTKRNLVWTVDDREGTSKVTTSARSNVSQKGMVHDAYLDATGDGDPLSVLPQTKVWLRTTALVLACIALWACGLASAGYVPILFRFRCCRCAKSLTWWFVGSVLEWSEQDVAQWAARSFGATRGHAFAAHNIDGSTLLELTDAELHNDLGITEQAVVYVANAPPLLFESSLPLTIGSFLSVVSSGSTCCAPSSSYVSASTFPLPLHLPLLLLPLPLLRLPRRFRRPNSTQC